MEPDLLGEQYRRSTIPLGADDEGEVVATLVSRVDAPVDGPAVLYVHGFSDYFFHPHVADFFVERGFGFYAVDLRKAGRSLRPHQTPHFVRHIPEYFADLDAATTAVRDRGHDSVILYGHSTGGLTGTLWTHRMRRHPWLTGLILNSPFFAMNIDRLGYLVTSPPLDIAGLFAPKHALPGGGPGINVQSLHRDHYGEWDFDMTWKPLEGTPVRLGWLRAVDRAQKLVRRGLNVGVPVLVAAATESYSQTGWDESAHTADAVLNADGIVAAADRIGDDVEVVRIRGGRHDLALSQLPARKLFFAEMDAWLSRHGLMPSR
ncbi:alpha/beta hydrolase [Stackebrandtia albiflava]|nr:alpha/beta hydrolase [Stackebrandtia albiflava]